MQFAMDGSGKKAYAENAERGLEYVCPLCGEPVILRRGEIKIPHFAHKSGRELCDGWHYDMSEWHYRMQLYFDEKYREVVVEKDGVKHRADILMNGVVVEFQHSPLPVREFKSRNDFYTACGYKVVWVVDVKESYSKGGFFVQEKNYNEDTDLYQWNFHKQWLDGVYNDSIVVFLSWCDIEADAVEIYRSQETEGTEAVYFNYPLLYKTPFKMVSGLDALSMFLHKPQVVKEERPVESTPVTPDAPCTLRFMFVPGQPKHTYVCPRSGKFGLELYASYKQPYGCLTCKHCSSVDVPLIREGHLNHPYYCVSCHYPAVVRDSINGASPSSECPALPIKNENRKPAESHNYFKRPSGYDVKRRGVSGLPPKAYTCPRSGKFGLGSKPTSYQPYACEYCKHCGDIVHYRENGTEIYCYYPRAVRVVTGEEPWECPKFERDKHLYKG